MVAIVLEVISPDEEYEEDDVAVMVLKDDVMPEDVPVEIAESPDSMLDVSDSVFEV